MENPKSMSLFNMFSPIDDYATNKNDDIEGSGLGSDYSPSRTSDSDVIIHINMNNENVNIDNVEGESKLVDYMNNSFFIQRQHSPDWYDISDVSFHSKYILSNSPVNNFDINSIDSDTNIIQKTDYLDKSSEKIGYSSDDTIASRPNHFSPISVQRPKARNKASLPKSKDAPVFTKLTYKEVERFINKYYNVRPDNKYSNELDILITYINGQKNLYIQSKYITQYRLNLLTVPSMLITAAITIIAPFIHREWWSGIIVSTLNAVILLLLSLINYLKYETDIENYMQNIKQYDKLETSLEMANNKLMFIEKDRDKNVLVLSKIKETEKKINELKESNTTIIPQEIKRIFPIISNINVFSFIKKVELGKRDLITKLRDVKNEIGYIHYKWEIEHILTDTNSGPMRRTSQVQNVEHLKERNRLQHLYDVKNSLKKEILDLMNAYTYIDNIFLREITIADTKKCWYLLFSCCYSNRGTPSYCKTNSPSIDKYVGVIFADL